MKTNKKLIAVGDIHGRDIWKDKFFGSTYDFQNWVTRDLANGIENEMADLYPFYKWDKIIFIGDYVDSFTVSNVEMKKNLEDIILFKKAYPDKIVLILGNHDIQYIVSGHQCSGYRPVMRPDLYQIFNENYDLFEMAHIVETTPGNPTLFTHAGVTKGWEAQLRAAFENTHSHKWQLFAEHAQSRIDNLINVAWKFEIPELFNVDRDSGGVSKYAGCLWVRPQKLQANAIDVYDQVVGHTPCAGVQTHPIDNNSLNVIYTIDCLEHYNSDDYLELDF